jgi:hypothetical protein
MDSLGKLNSTMATANPWTDDELRVFAYIKALIENQCVKLSSEAEVFIRREFDWVTTSNSYHLAMTYGRNRQKIDMILAERQRAEDPENVKANCCHTCEATS